MRLNYIMFVSRGTMLHMCSLLQLIMYVTVNENYGFQRYPGLYCYDDHLSESPQDTEYDCYRFCEVHLFSFNSRNFD